MFVRVGGKVHVPKIPSISLSDLKQQLPTLSLSIILSSQKVQSKRKEERGGWRLTLIRVGGGQDGAVVPLHLLHLL